MFHIDFARILTKLINKNGIINVGGKSQSVYDFAKKHNTKVKKTSYKKNSPSNVTMSLVKLKKIIN